MTTHGLWGGGVGRCRRDYVSKLINLFTSYTTGYEEEAIIIFVPKIASHP